MVFGGLLSLYLWRWVPRHTRKAPPVPDEAEIVERGRLKWWALAAGLGLGFAAIGRAADDSVVVSGVLTGIVGGGVVGYSVGVRRLARWQAGPGQELLQWRRRGLRNPRHNLRPIGGPRSGRFARDAAHAATR